MSIRLFRAASLIACSAVTLLAQEPSDQQESVASRVTVNQQENQSAAPAAAGLAAVAYCNTTCTGFTTSTGNLYFTTYQIDEFGSNSVASLYRTSKTGTPGSAGLLYEEVGEQNFGMPVWAYVGGTYYAYFSANYNNFGVHTSQIKRVPLSGGSAIILAYSPAPITSLLTDGARLFWADTSGIRSMPIGGGAIQSLATIQGTGRILIGLDANYVYYSIGSAIRRIPKTGGTSTLIVAAPSVVTALYVAARSSTTLFWGEQSGAVRSLGASGLQTHQNSISGRSATWVGFDGIRVLWIDCTQPGNSYCTVKTKLGTNPATPVTGAGVGAGNLQWDATSMYWNNVASIEKYVH